MNKTNKFFLNLISVVFYQPVFWLWIYLNCVKQKLNTFELAFRCCQVKGSSAIIVGNVQIDVTQPSSEWQKHLTVRFIDSQIIICVRQRPYGWKIKILKNVKNYGLFWRPLLWFYGLMVLRFNGFMVFIVTIFW